MSAERTAAYDFLNAHNLGILSTVSDKHEPWGAAVYYAVDDRFNFYFLTRVSSHKYQNIHQQPHAAITVADNTSQTTAQAYGKVSKVPLDDEHDMAFRKLAEIHPPGQHNWGPPVSKIHGGETILLKLTPSVLQFANFKPEHEHKAPATTYIKRII